MPGEWIVAVACGGWAVVFLIPSSIWAVPIALSWAALVLFLPQRPAVASVLLVLEQTGLILVEETRENPGALATLLIAVYYLGRHARPRFGAPLAAFFLLEVIVEGADAPTLIFAGMVIAAAYVFGYLVRARAAAADRAESAASTLVGVNANDVAEKVVAEERIRLGAQVLDIVRSSVDAMRREAARAGDNLDPALIQAIVDRGTTAVTELQWLLGLLRSPAPPPQPGSGTHSRRWLLDVALAGALVLVAIVDVVASGQQSQPLAWALTLAFPLTVLVRRSRPALASAGAAGIVFILLLIPAPILVGTGIAALVTLVTFVLLSWSTGAAGRWEAWAAFSALSASIFAWFAAFGPENLPMTLGILGLPAFAAHEWSLSDRKRLLASVRADRLQSDLDEKVQEALSQARLRIARDLHDVTSHAVGVMVLQASAAQALRKRDPAAARRALDTVRTAGEQAMTELGMMVSLLDSESGWKGAQAGSFPESLDALASRVRAAGLDITVEADDVPAAFANTAYHVVQEGLTNVIRHSTATQADVSIRVREDTLTVRVADNGSGPSRVPEVTDGFGLFGLGERVHSLGGEFSAKPGSSGGFEVVAAIPVDSETRR
jgi:signal transduction histidine kinase